jgi:hypothetical protein
MFRNRWLIALGAIVTAFVSPWMRMHAWAAAQKRRSYRLVTPPGCKPP